VEIGLCTTALLLGVTSRDIRGYTKNPVETCRPEVPREFN
jgi:hypothetical protein